MALPSRPMHVPAGLPIDESTRRELLDVGNANVSANNVRHNKKGALEKRLGFGPLVKTRSVASSRSAGRRLFAHNGVPTIIDGSFLDSYVEAASANFTRSRVPECSYRLMDLPTPSASAYLYDVEYCNGFVAVSSGLTFGGAGCVCVIEADTGALVRAPESLVAGNVRIILGSFSSRYLVACVYVIGTGNTTAYLLDTQAMGTGWTFLATIAAPSSTSPSICSLSDRVAISYGTASGTDRVWVDTYNESGIIQSRSVNTASVTPGLMSLDGSIAGTLWLAWAEGLNVKAIGLDADALSTTFAASATVLTATTAVSDLAICEGPTAGTARAWVLSAILPSSLSMCSITTVASTTTPGAATTVRNATPISRPFVQDGRYYSVFTASTTAVGINGNTQGLCIVADWTDDVTYVRPVANVEPGLCPGQATVCKVSPVGTSGRRIYGFQVVKTGSVNFDAFVSGSGTTSCSLVEFDFASRQRWQVAEHANSTYLGGAILSVYDGDRVTEAGFLARPNRVQGSLAGTGITGTYRCVAVYEDIDAAGNWVVSGVSDVSASVTAANNTITWSTTPMTISSRIAKGTTRVVFYRTANGGEPPYYRLGAVANDTSLGLVSYADTTTDTTLTTRAKLYAPNLPGAAGEALDRRAPPGLVHITSYNGMLVGAKGESVIFSGQEIYGEATWFSPVFEIPITGGGDITGLRALDGTLFVFKADRIYAVAGEAPSDNGLQGGLGSPRLIASDVGCIESESLLVTSLGIFFQSRHGIELLTRAQAVEPIGEPIQDTLASFPVVTSAVLDDRNGLARFTLAASESPGVVSGGGRTAVYDLTTRSWVSVDDVRGTSASEAAQSASLVHLGGEWRYAWLGTDGTVYAERDEDDATAYLDGTNWVTAQYELPPWKIGLQQEQRIYEMLALVERYSAAGLQIDVALDYSTTYSNVDGKTWSETATANQRQFPFRPKPQTTAVQLRIRDTAPAILGTGRGFAFIGISADIAPKQGPTRGTTRLDPSLRR